MNTASFLGLGTLPSNTGTNPKEDLKGITTRIGTAYQGTTIPASSSSSPKVVERETELTKDTVPPTNNGSTKKVQPLVILVETSIPNSEPVVAPVAEPIAAPVSAPKPNQKPSIPYLSRLHDQKLRDKTNDQNEKIFQIFQDLNFNISFADALILMPKFGPTIKSLLTNKDKLYELARTPLNEHCSAVLLKKLPEKLGDPGKRSFLKTEKALIDVFKGELTLRVGKEAITFNLDQTSRYSANYNDITANRIDVIDMDCEEYSQEVLRFFDVITSGNPTPYYDPIVSTSSPTLTPFGDSDFILPASSLGSGTLPSNTVTNPKEDLKGITTRSGPAYQGPTIPSSSTLPKVVNRETEVTKDTVLPTNNGGVNTCNALADLGASINLMPHSAWKDLSLPELTPTCITLELADRSITEPIGIAKDVHVTVGKFQFPVDFVVVDFEPDPRVPLILGRSFLKTSHALIDVYQGKFQFPVDFVVVDFEPDPRVPLILGRSFLKTSHALIDVYQGEITLRVGKEAITFNLDRTSRYTANYDHITANRIDVIDMACEEYSQEVLGLSNMITSGNPTPNFDPIVSTSSPTLTPFGDSDFFLFEEANSFLALEDGPTSLEVDDSYYDSEGDILLLE
nr:reverse transcriptase domain-containing protein [Tanacetum cinerariifolium]